MNYREEQIYINEILLRNELEEIKLNLINKESESDEMLFMY